MNSTVALCDVVCSDRWDEAWASIAELLRLGPREQAEAQRGQRQCQRATLVQGAVPEGCVVAPGEDRTPPMIAADPEALPSGVKDKPASGAAKAAGAPRRSAPNYRWRRMAIGQAQRAA